MYRFIYVAVLLCVIAVPLLALQPESRVATPGTEPVTATKAKPLGGEWEVKYIDDSTMKITVLDDVVTLITAYGPLNIPLAEIQKIEVGTRLGDAEQLRLQNAEADVRSTDAKKRETGKETLQSLGVKAIPAIRRAMKTSSPESRPHFDHVLSKLIGQLDDPKNEPQDMDVIHTENSKIAGRLNNPNLRIQTFQFGELKLKLSDAKMLAFSGYTTDEKLEIVETDYIYKIIQTHMGKTIGIRVTGRIGGSVWGSSPYTGDTDLGTAAVHSGVLKIGETGIIKVKLIPSPQAFLGTTANGVTSSSYGPYSSGAYEIIKRK